MTPEMLGELFATHRQNMLNCAHSLATWKAEDLLHDAAVDALQSNTEPGKPDKWFSTVLYGVNATQAALANAPKRKRVEVSVDDYDHAIPYAGVDAARELDLEWLLEILPAQERAVIDMYIMGYTFPEIANELSICSTNRARQIKWQAERRMRDYVNS